VLFERQLWFVERFVPSFECIEERLLDVLRASVIVIAGVRELVQHQVVEKVELPRGNVRRVLGLRFHHQGIVAVILPRLGERGGRKKRSDKNGEHRLPVR